MKNKFTILGRLALLTLVGCNTMSSSGTSGEKPSASLSPTTTPSTSDSTSTASKKILLIEGAGDKASLQVGDSLSLTAVAKDGTEIDEEEWTSSDPSVLSVENGFVKALTPGSAEIRVSQGEYQSDPLSLTVESIVPVESLTIQNAPTEITVGETITLQTSILPSTANQNIEIASSSDAIAVDAKAKTIKAIEPTDEEVTITLYASKDFTKTQRFKRHVKSGYGEEKVTISFSVPEEYAKKESLSVPKGETVDYSLFAYDPFTERTDKSKANDIVFFGFYFDPDYSLPVTYPFTSTYSDLTLYGKFVDLKTSQGYNWNYTYDSEKKGYNVDSLTSYSTVGISELSVGIPAYHEGKPVVSFNKIATNDFVNRISQFALPNTITSIPENARNYWTKLSYLYLPSDAQIVSVPDHAFQSLKALTSLYLPDTITSIGKSAFESDASLESIYRPKSLLTVDEAAFSNCSKLSSLDFSSVETIADYAFRSASSLKRIHFPQNLKSIGTICVFRQCLNIERISVDKDNLFYSSDDFGALYNHDKSIRYKAPTGLSCTNAYIPETVTEIYDNAFRGSKAEILKIPFSVTTIHYGVFGRRVNLKAAYIPSSVTVIKDNSFSICNDKELTLYVAFAKDSLPAKWSSYWNQNSNNDQRESSLYRTVYGFDASRFVF